MGSSADSNGEQNVRGYTASRNNTHSIMHPNGEHSRCYHRYSVCDSVFVLQHTERKADKQTKKQTVTEVIPSS